MKQLPYSQIYRRRAVDNPLQRGVFQFEQRPAAVIRRDVQRQEPRASASYSIHTTDEGEFEKPMRRKMALLLPGHNEELIIAKTIASAVASGQPLQDIYVVDDCSTDATAAEARAMLPPGNVLTVPRSGKALAVRQAISHFKLEKRYEWLHVADADSVFGEDYFRVYRRHLDDTKYSVAVGFVQSLRGNWISTYRALTYTYSQHVNRRIQSWLGMISVFPGPITCFRTDIINQLDFATGSLTEDFDITLQVHRKNLGGIKFIPKAVNYTQDPQTLRDYCKQTARWQRGFFQGVKKYRVGGKFQRIDLSIGYQLFQAIIYLLQYWVLLPYLILTTGNWVAVPVILAADFIGIGLTAFFSAGVTRRWNLLGALPYFYILRWIEIYIFFASFFEVMILGRFKHAPAGWDTEGRRYSLNAIALQDTAR
jgi:cellulose synthase/poly-beta-1,6-N-acetylglucosamine synthase-like glycosyltransferase